MDSPPTPTPRILLVDGNYGSLYALAELLEGEGFEVATAASAQQGLLRAGDFRPDVALIDLQMPIMNGIEMLRQLRLSELPVTVMMMTAGASAATQRQSQLLGAVDVLEKPLDVDDVVSRIRTALATPAVQEAPPSVS